MPKTPKSSYRDIALKSAAQNLTPDQYIEVLKKMFGPRLRVPIAFLKERYADLQAEKTEVVS